MIITIGGAPGSGKSTVGRMLAARLAIPFYSMGDIRRKYAREHNMTLEELNARAQHDPTSDRLVDEYQQELAKSEDTFVLDSRLGCHFIPKSLKVYITVDRREAAERIMSQRRDIEHWSSTEEGMHALAAREESDRQRYQKLYNIDTCDVTRYDIVIDSTGMSPLQLLNALLTQLKERGISSQGHE